MAILRPQRNFNLEKVFLNKNNENVFLNKNKNHIRIEFRPGIGGDEAELWSKELKKVNQNLLFFSLYNTLQYKIQLEYIYTFIFQLLYFYFIIYMYKHPHRHLPDLSKLCK